MKQQQEEEEVTTILITGAAGQIAYSLIPMIGSGMMLGPNRKVKLHLLEIPQAFDALKGVCMEIEDSAYPLIKEVIPTTDLKEAFSEIDICLMLGSFPRKDGMQRRDLLEKNADIYKTQGEALEKYAKKSVKVLVIGNPANTNCLIAKTYAPSIPSMNFTALTRLDHNRACCQIAKKLGIDVTDVHNVVIWGNHSTTQVPDVSNGYVSISGEKKLITDVINDEAYIKKEFFTTVSTRGEHVISLRKQNSATSAAKAVVDHMKDWILGTKEEDWVSMAIPSDGSYNIKEGLIFSFPVICKDGKISIVQDLPISSWIKEKLEITEKELLEEKSMVFPKQQQ
ncbi:hypothetical protein ABK040_009642 [Willaertia magna]